MNRQRLIVVAIAVAVGLGLLMITYEVIGVDFTSFMEDQPAVEALQPPRRLPPEEALPLSRPAYLDQGQAPANPVPADEVSLQRGGILFELHCAVCHGSGGQGDGPVVQYWGPDARRPADLTAQRIVDQADGEIYRTIRGGFGAMPPLRENLTERQRWDVVNYLRTLQP